MTAHINPIPMEIRHAHLFCGLGGGAKGFNKGRARVGTMEARPRCIGGFDIDPRAIADFEKLSGVRGTVIDLMDRSQYIAFHGKEPPAGWREATPADIRRGLGNERPHVWFLSAPCKGFSGLLSETRSKTDKYQALNRLTLRGIWLALEAFVNDPAELLIFENVPRIATRGRHLLDQIIALLERYGYVVRETTHDCGELGGLAQSRKRFLLVARHIEKVPPFLYEPEKKRLQPVSAVLGRMPLPGDLAGGPMHRVPSLQWKTWVRLAFVEAGKDWRSLQSLRVADGVLTDFAIVPTSDYHRGYCGVRRWDQPTGTVTGRGTPSTGAFAIADPRGAADAAEYSQYGVLEWDKSMGTVSGQSAPGGGKYSIADPRHTGPAKHSNEYRIVPWADAAMAVTSAHGTGQCVADPRGGKEPSELHGKYHVTPWDDASRTVIAGNANGAFSVADPRTDWPDSAHGSKLAVTGFEQPSKTVTGARFGSGALSVADPRTGKTTHSGFGVLSWDATAGTVAGESLPSNGSMSIADPRPNLVRTRGDAYLTAGHYGVCDWDAPAGAVSAAAGHDNGRWSVADPREAPICADPQNGLAALPAAGDKLICRIIARDGTWHRPFTTLELAALQSLVDPEEQLELDGLSDQDWRERIGNAVPSDAAQAVADTMYTTLLLAWSGETFMLSSQAIWVRPVAMALTLPNAYGAMQ
ncbi:DNA cytosine methyltransferase [Robbsia sp. KACC 23696]|uniref:DNA cytosine methyltransferase n=1 Tax=Robbsia sp. KACC 23696 TaxID=3149231 RepID=UPI00325AF1A9